MKRNTYTKYPQSKRKQSKPKPPVLHRTKCEPLIFAFGDVEGDVQKCIYDINIIETHRNSICVFLGDFFDDLSEGPQRQQNMSCLELIKSYLYGDIKFKEDQDDENDESNAISLPSSFSKLKFNGRNYSELNGRRVIFIAGNSECDCLQDIINNLNDGYRKEDETYIFGEGKWKKKFTFEEMCLLYLYFSNCSSYVEFESDNASSHKGIKSKMYFRHSLTELKNYSLLEQEIKVSSSDAANQNFIFITGHMKLFTCTGPTEHPDETCYYIVDTSTVDPKKDRRDPRQYPRSIRGKGRRDFRIAAVSFDDENGYSVSTNPESDSFYQWHRRFSYKDILLKIE